MTGPTREEVEALASNLVSVACCLEDCDLDRQADNARAAASMLRALRERAEAAEAERDRQYDENVNRIAMQARAENERDAARRAEAAAWNDAIEAAGNLESIHGYSNAVPRHRIRALRRAAPTEGEA